MRKKSGFTMIEQAIVLVPEFEKVVRKLEQQVTLRGQSKRTFNKKCKNLPYVKEPQTAFCLFYF